MLQKKKKKNLHIHMSFIGFYSQTPACCNYLQELMCADL